MGKIGIIGYGKRIGNFMDRMMENDCGVQVVAIADPQQEKVKATAAEKGFENVRFYTDAEEMLKTEELDGVCIGTRCSQHTPLALLAANYNVKIFLEKPVAINQEQLDQLCTRLDRSGDFLISFPLRFTSIVKKAKEIVDSGKLGQIAHIQAYNNVPYARGYYHGWYRDEAETGGLFLQKSTHDFDYINYLVGLRPVRICAMESKQVFQGDKPAGLTCDKCPDARTCPESARNVKTYGDRYSVQDDWGCCFAVDTGNHDSGSVIIEYENGMHAVYSQNFIARKGAMKRGARLIGYYGTLEFDFNTGVIQVWYHNEGTSETYSIAKGLHHFGGDNILAQNFIDMMAGTAPSKASLREGILSAKMCLAAKNSAKNHQFYTID